MKYFILSGSHRKNSQSSKVAHYLKDSLSRLFPEHNSDLFSLEDNPLPLWDEGVWNGSERWQEKWSPVKDRLEQADAFICVTPEWGGMVSPGVKNFLLLSAGSALSHKAGLICSVSGSRNGAYPVAELRMTSSKNTQINWIPEHLIIRDVESMLNSGPPKGSDDEYIRQRIDYSLSLLHEYSKALSLVRQSGVIDSEKFPFGM